MSDLRAIAFDKDGTLFDFNATWGAWLKGFLMDLSGSDAAVMKRAADRLGFDVASAKFAQNSLVIAATAEDVRDALLSVMPDADPDVLWQDMLTTTAAARQVEVVPLAPFLAGLKAQGLKLGVATNDAEAPARSNLASVGAEQAFDHIYGFDSGHGGKPAPGQLLAFAKAVDIEPLACAMVGDSLHDLHAARAAGFTAIGVLTGVAEEEELAPAADVVLRSIADLPAWLDR